MSCTPDTEYIDRVTYQDRIQHVEVIKTEVVYEDIIVYDTIRVTDTVYIDNIIYVYEQLPTYIYDVRSIQRNSYNVVVNQLAQLATDPLYAIFPSNNLTNGEEINYFNEVSIEYHSDSQHVTHDTYAQIWLYIEEGTHIETLILHNTRAGSEHPTQYAFQPYEILVNTLDFTIGNLIIADREYPWGIEVLGYNSNRDYQHYSIGKKELRECIAPYEGGDLFGYTYSDLSYEIGQVINIDGAMYEILNKGLTTN